MKTQARPGAIHRIVSELYHASVAWERHWTHAMFDSLPSRAGNRSQPPGADRPRPDSLEGVLVDQLFDGLITRGQYLRAMEHVAASEDKHHPLAVPPEKWPILAAIIRWWCN